MKAQDHTPLVVAATGSGAAMTCFYGRDRRDKSKMPAHVPATPLSPATFPPRHYRLDPTASRYSTSAQR